MLKKILLIQKLARREFVNKHVGTPIDRLFLIFFASLSTLHEYMHTLHLHQRQTGTTTMMILTFEADGTRQ